MIGPFSKSINLILMDHCKNLYNRIVLGIIATLSFPSKTKKSALLEYLHAVQANEVILVQTDEFFLRVQRKSPELMSLLVYFTSDLTNASW